jgi:hypothetical protein
LFEIHNHVKKRVYTALLNCSKYAWSENKKKKLHFIIDDFSRVFLDINEDFLYSDFDIFVSDGTKENQNVEALRSLMQAAMQNGASLSDAAMVLTTDSVSEIRRKLKDIDTQRAKQMEDQQKQQQQMAQQMHAEEQQGMAEDRRVKEEDSIRKSDTAIQVALIGADKRGNESESVSEPEEIDPLEIQRVSLEKMKIEREARIKEQLANETVRSNKANEKLKEKELVIKRKQASKPSISKK